MVMSNIRNGNVSQVNALEGFNVKKTLNIKDAMGGNMHRHVCTYQQCAQTCMYISAMCIGMYVHISNVHRHVCVTVHGIQVPRERLSLISALHLRAPVRYDVVCCQGILA